MKTLSQTQKFVAATGLAFLAVAFAWNPLAGAASGGSDSNAQPANKISVAGSTIEHMTEDHLEVTLFSTEIKTSSPTDLLLTVNAECALWTEVIASDNVDLGPTHSEAEARVRVWIEVAGQTVLVDSNDENEPGKVVYCHRIHGLEIIEEDTDEDDDNATVRNYLRTRNANSFQWVLLNAGSGTHSVVVKAELDATQNLGDGSAEAAVGKRTLVVEPVKLANNASI